MTEAGSKRKTADVSDMRKHLWEDYVLRFKNPEKDAAFYRLANETMHEDCRKEECLNCEWHKRRVISRGNLSDISSLFSV